MKPIILSIRGWGIYSDQFANAAALTDAVRVLVPSNDAAMAACRVSPVMESKRVPETALDGLDKVTQYAISALHEAWHSAERNPDKVEADRTALVLLTGWGPMESTLGYLDSMLESGGRYASPRHFTRSVYSSVASHAAIYLGIHGTCETLAHGVWPICSVLDRAADILDSGRADQVLVCWADQHSDVVIDLCRRAVVGLGRVELERFTGGRGGCGGVALVLRRADMNESSNGWLELLPREIQDGGVPSFLPGLKIHPYPTDDAVHLAAVIAATQLALSDKPILWTEVGRHQRKRVVRIWGRQP